MVLTDYILLVGIGFVVGIVAGFIGIGGNVILIPIVLYYLKLSGIPETVLTHITYGSMLLVTFVTAISTTIRMHIQKMILWKLVPWLVLGSILSTQGLGSILKSIQGSFLQLAFATFIFILGVRWFFARNQKDPENPRFIKPFSLVITGIVIGAISLLTGLGGGIILIPLLAGYYHISTLYLAGTSGAVLIFTALSAVVSYLWSGWGHPDLPKGALGYLLPHLSFIIAIGTIPGAQIGAKLNKQYGKQWFRLVFAIIQIGMSSWMFWNLKEDILGWLGLE
ncbi:MAG: sulfite exporter TauE/SafE family protein [bacterium]|nr:sulfite exporter TauE/SafE family protein [bacterium]